jgi:sterol desaturase/sphingolipid hydroxylase (fatty acid hydroxylase superfamily)
MAVEALVLGFAHDWLHTTFHLQATRLLRFKWYRGWRIAHFYHHRNMKKNYGIFWFGWDRALGTFCNDDTLWGRRWG